MAGKQLHIEAFQSVCPVKMSDPGRSRPITVAAPVSAEALQSRFVVIFYYNKAVEHESALLLAAWMRESLGVALVEEPALAGRLRRPANGGDDGLWEIKANDAGVRLVQASLDMTVSDFLDLKDRKQKESLLAYWADVDKENPDYSALFYVQVTRFQEEGYSIGISCSLLLADPWQLTKFLKSWALTHAQMLSQGHLSKDPIFHLSFFQRRANPNYIKSIPLDYSSKPTITTTTTVLFKSSQKPSKLMPSLNKLVASEAVSKLGDHGAAGGVSNFYLFLSEEEGLKVERWSEDVRTNDSLINVEVVHWEEFCRVEELSLMEGNKAVHVSYDIISRGNGEGIVVVMSPHDEEGDSNLVISATIPTGVKN
ncbi:uncharacterized protein [Typha angustifolia]|uniref:uncharacterized protein n=1 Tax=Typha angustifolia TaxID=59011 RepID=UPI003C2D6159